jgi:signal transduction histidine kinase
MHSFLGVPVAVRGRTIGNLYLTEKAGGFTDEDQREIETFARHAGIAMENARLHDQVQRLAIVEERERIGKDLHDGVIQAIYAVGLSLDDVPDMMDGEPDEARRRVERAIDALDQTIRDIRNFIFGLRPALLDGVDVVEGLAALADEFRVNTMIDVELRAGPTVTTPVIGPDRTVELLAIAREALSNIARHARATRAEISVEPEPEIAGVEIVVADNGTGFDPAAPRGIGHQGLRNMRTRAISIGATLLVDSHPGGGTRIIVRVPGTRVADEDELAGGSPDA